MRFGRTSKALGVAAVAALALSACAANTGTETPEESAEGEATGGNIRVVEVNAFSSFNSNSSEGNVDINGKIAYATHSGFNYINNDLEVVPNEDFGSMEVLSEDPLSVKYTVNEGVNWSDGEPVDGGDLLLSWAIGSGYFNDSKLDDAGEVVSGATYFDYAGDTAGLALTELPEIGEDGRSITLNYSEPFADYEVAFGLMTEGGISTPAHVLAEKGGLADEDALIELIQTTPAGDPESPVERPEVQALADFWNTGFDTKSLPTDPSLFLSNGPFVASAITPDQSMTLTRNEDYNWGPEPKVDEITVRYIGEAPAQVQALQNGEVDIIAPQASADTVEQLEGLEGVTVEQGNQLSYDHLDLNFSGVFEDEAVREAFMKTVPRQQLVDTITKKINPDAEPLDSQLFLTDQEPYEEAASTNGSEAYAEVDIEGAKELLDGATPEVRIMYNRDNPNRLNSYTLIAESAAQAGFKIVDGGLGSSDWGSALGNGTYDATIFGWINSGVGVSGVPQIFKSGNGSNFNGFSSPEADKLMDELIVTTDPAEQDALQVQIDKLIWDSKYGLPLFQVPGVDAFSDNVSGIEYMPNQTGVWWNFWDWQVVQ
ncbi:MAG: transporter substrate-binding protein [Micrococcaceae bacterium]|uniref:ABC transporter family substrate-binding protein n=1 Tax=Arthrobacter cheniae TaxID=1258888 RepID=A0A3A5M270_9MICC|nr:ABC transporter family substrate-binding protein [Arthrobacter cheniae]MCU1631677.1 transporter substrate-binding protein [Micrococcaceae bacterium]MEC5197919.1 peptide/nickel transport system substrate-binding protein [Arthrobacter sp. PL16]RJT78368.1 ABC transporter family substrate-binding protein [Arthrobacter cheniae]